MQTLRTERDGPVLLVTIDNPPRQYFNWQLVLDLEALMATVEKDRTLRCVVFTGAPDDVFLNHYDVEEILEQSAESLPQLTHRLAKIVLPALEGVSRVRAIGEALLRSPIAGAVAVRRIHDLFRRFNRSHKVILAAINGHTVAGGCELALACDIRYMAEDRLLALPEITLGVIPGFGGTQRLARALGTPRALEMLLEARDFTAQEAQALGLVHRAVPADRLLDEVRATAQRLARRPADAVWAIKRAVYDGGGMALDDGLRFERSVFAVAASGTSARRGLAGMIEEIRAGGGAGPGMDPATLRPWQEGTMVDYSAD